MVIDSFLGLLRDKNKNAPVPCLFCRDRSGNSFCGATRLGAIGAHSAHSNKCRHMVTACLTRLPY